MTKILGWGLVMMSLASYSGASEQPLQGAEGTKSHYNIIFHIDSDSEAVMKKTLRNAHNVLEDPRLKDKITVEILANSGGHKLFLKTGAFEKELKDLDSKGVILAECMNTLEENKIEVSAFHSFVRFVPTGAGELAIRQADGWAYIHPSP